MEEPWLQLHPEFKLNGKNYSLAGLINLTEALQLEGDDDEKLLAEFVLSWLYPKDTMLVNTSGSTGRPKMVTMEKEKMIASAKATGNYFNLPAGTTALLGLSPAYIAGKMMLVRAMVLGWHLDVVIPNKKPLSQTKKSYDFTAMVPYQVQYSLNELHRVKKIIVGGAPVSLSLEEQLQDIPAMIYATYGMTETITHVAIKKLNHKTNSDGKKESYEALSGIKFSTDTRNCLIIDAPAILNESLITNDVVELISETKFNWLGRVDFVINSGGHKIHPEQVEKILAKVIENPFFITSVTDEKLGEKVVLIIEGKEDNYPEIDYIGLHPYEVPKRIFFVKELTYTPSGKINREQTKQNLIK